MQQSIVFWYLFNFILKKISSINIALKNLLLETINKRFDKQKISFDDFYKS